MALYEPTLFALLDAEAPPPNETEGIRNTVAEASIALDAGNQDAAAKPFIDYWMGTGSWERMPEQRRAPDRGIGEKRAPLGTRPVDRAHAAGGIQ